MDVELNKNTNFLRNYQKSNKNYENMFWIKLAPGLSVIQKTRKFQLKLSLDISLYVFIKNIKLVQIY